jgi:hypothetical protein
MIEASVMMSSSEAKQLSTESATDWYINWGQEEATEDDGESLLLKGNGSFSR